MQLRRMCILLDGMFCICYILYITPCPVSGDSDKAQSRELVLCCMLYGFAVCVYPALAVGRFWKIFGAGVLRARVVVGRAGVTC